MNITTRAFVSALGTAAYVSLFPLVIYNADRFFGGKEPGAIVAPMLFLLVFIISACITSSLVLLKPVLMFMEGHKKEALRLFGYTVGFLVGFAVILVVVLVVR
ncbi:MAG: hypothetical protein KW806_02155 [Candidatus Yanofskybacteria bacterium]|nr:hypothetical protein [Candidatus Yanofskybacteria bacterium]